MHFPAGVRRLLAEAGVHPDQELARLILEARGDRDLRARLQFLLRLPPAQRESLVNTALREMRLRSEPTGMRLAFAMLGTDEGAHSAIRLLADK